MAHKPKAKHPASDHLRAAADALDAHHQATMGKQPEEQLPAGQPPPGAQVPGGVMPPGMVGGMSPLGGRAR